MSDIVLVTESEFYKADAAFHGQDRFQVHPVPPDESSLGQKVLEHNCRAVIAGTARYTGKLYEALGKTGGTAGSIIARFGVGHDGIDERLAKQHNIVVTNTPGVLDQSVAEHTIWLIGALTRRIAAADANVRNGNFESQTGLELVGRTLGIIGFGAIGRRVARIAHAGFGLHVLAADCQPTEQLERQEGKNFEQLRAQYGLEHYTSDTASVFSEADIVSIHLPGTEETRHFVDENRFQQMKPTTLLVNTARGSIVDEDALYDALGTGAIAGAALDVFENEPYTPTSPGKDLRTLDNILLTPHIGSNTQRANQRMGLACLDNLAKFFAGRLDELTRVD